MRVQKFKSRAKWYDRPIRCVFGLHNWQWHPGSNDLIKGLYCRGCNYEKWTPVA